MQGDHRADRAHLDRALAAAERAGDEVQRAMGRIEESIADDKGSRAIYQQMESRWICLPLAVSDAYAMPRRGAVAG